MTISMVVNALGASDPVVLTITWLRWILTGTWVSRCLIRASAILLCPWLTVPSLASLPKLLEIVPTLGGLTNLKPAILLVAWVMFIDSTRSIMVFSDACRTLGLAN